MDYKKIAIFGSSGAVGREAVRHALKSELEVVAIDRAVLEGTDRIDGVTYRQADVLKSNLEEVVHDCDAVVSTLGVAFSPKLTVSAPPPLYSVGTRRIVETMRASGLNRIAVISAAFVIDQPHLPAWFRATVVPALHNVLDEMRTMEAYLEEQHDIEWTAARPGWLVEMAASGDLLVEESRLPEGAFRCRTGDLAAFLIGSIRNRNHINGKPAIGSREEEKFESPFALAKEFAPS